MSNHEIRGYISLLYSIADKPLDLWSKHVSLGGRVRRIRDDTLHGDRVIEIAGPHDSAVPTNIAIPAKMSDVLNIKLSVLILIIKNLNLRFKFEVQMIDKKQYRRKFSFMTYNLEKLPSISTNTARIALKLEECWNLLEIDLQALCREAYGADYEALQRLIIYPNCHLRRVYLQDRHYNQDEIPIYMYQAFFDMYMSKWGMNFIDRTCQTEECGRGSLKSNCSIRNNVIDAISNNMPTKAYLSKNVHSMDGLENLSLSNTISNLNNFNTLKRNYMSLNILNSAIKMHDKQNIIKKQSKCESSINDPIAENKVSDDNNNNIKKEIRNTMKIYNVENFFKKSTNIKSNNNVLQSAAFVELEKVSKSQFLKMHVSEMLFGNNTSSTHSHLHRIQSVENIQFLTQKTV